MTSAVVFAYSEVGVRCLRVLLRHGVRISQVITHEDDPAEQRWFGSVAELAREQRIPVIAPENPDSEELVQALTRLEPDFLFSFYYRRMLSDRLLKAAASGALNMHGSLLPKYRGRAPINWAIIHGETETGASLHYMQSRPDAGPLVAQEAVPILINDTALDVSMKVAAAAERVLDRSLPDLIRGQAPRIELELSRGSYFGARRPEDGRIRWDRPALEIHNLIRAVAPPFPGAFGDFGTRILRALGSRYEEQRALFPHVAPCLYSEGSELKLDCRDGRRLTLTSAELDGAPFDADAFARRYGSDPFPLVPSQQHMGGLS